MLVQTYPRVTEFWKLNIGISMCSVMWQPVL